MTTRVRFVVWAMLVLAALLPLTSADAGPEEGQWSLVFYRGSNNGVKCGNDDIVCMFKNNGTIEEPRPRSVHFSGPSRRSHPPRRASR